MRLIDADELLKKLREVKDEDPKELLMAREKVLNVIFNAPTIIKCGITSEGLPLLDLTPRTRGEWIYNDYGNGCGNWHCSVCDHMPYYATKYMRFLNFCPNCGADLRGWTNDS